MSVVLPMLFCTVLLEQSSFDRIVSYALTNLGSLALSSSYAWFHSRSCRFNNEACDTTESGRDGVVSAVGCGVASGGEVDAGRAEAVLWGGLRGGFLILDLILPNQRDLMAGGGVYLSCVRCNFARWARVWRRRKRWRC